VVATCADLSIATNLVDDQAITSNWGNKLNRNAHNVQLGQLFAPRPNAEQIDYNGYKRRIISRNPLYMDEDGDLVDDEGDVDENIATPVEPNPYKDIRLEGIYSSIHDLEHN
jgi:hypothetical protein